MDQNRQKILIGVLAVIALGAGSYWFVFRESAPAQREEAAAGPVEVRKREKAAPTVTKTRARAERPAAAAPPTEVRTRERPEETSGPNRTRAKPTEKLNKKEKRPAAS